MALLLDEPPRWLDAIVTLLFGGLNHCDAQLFDTMHTPG